MVKLTWKTQSAHRNSGLHAARPIREIFHERRVMRSQRKRDPIILDSANDAWLTSDGVVATREPGNEWTPIANLNHLRGAARISAALSALKAFRRAA